LLRHNELATGKVSTWLRQKNGKLERENVLSVEILMEAVVIVGRILK